MPQINMLTVYLRRLNPRMRKFNNLTLIALFLLLFCWQGSKATHFYVNTLTGIGHGSLYWALNQVNNDKTATLANPHVIDILASGDAALSPLPRRHCIINCPKDMSLKLSGLNYNVTDIPKGIHVCINNAVFDKATYNADNGPAFTGGNGTNLTLSDCLFINNAARFKGGAVFCDGDSVYLYGCTFKNNSTTNSNGGGGAAVFNNSGYMQIVNCTFSNNTSVALSEGGGAINNCGEMDVINCRFYGNQSANTGGAILNRPGSVCRIGNNLFSGNGAANNGNDLKGEFIWLDDHNHFESPTDAGIAIAQTNYKANTTSLINTALLTVRVGADIVKQATDSFNGQGDLAPVHEFTIVTCDEQGETTEVYSVKGERITFVKGQITKLSTAAVAQGL